MKLYELLKSLLFTLLISSLGVCNASAAAISGPKAVELVKETRTDNDGVWFYYLQTDTTLQMTANIPLQLLSTYPWLSDGSDKWLVFVDESPRSLWAHPCTYYYLPCEVADTLNVPICSIADELPPSSSNLTFVNTVSGDSAQTPSLAPLTPDYSYIDSLSLTELDGFNPQETYVLIASGGFNEETNSIAFYNDLKYLYNVLTKKYRIPSYHVNVLYGCGPNATNSQIAYSYNTPISVSHDLDDDGIPDIDGSITPSDIISALERLKIALSCPRLNDDSKMSANLLIVFDLHGKESQDKTESLLLPWGYNKSNPVRVISSSKVKELLDQIPCNTQNIMIGACHSGQFIEALQAPGRTITTACELDESAYTNYYYAFFNSKWTAALSGRDLAGNPVNADFDGNGLVSIEEAFRYAQTTTFDFPNNLISIEEIRQDENLQHPRYCSSPEWIGKNYAINHPTDSVNLFIRDNATDTGIEANQTTNVTWLTPDLWLSPDSTATTHQAITATDTVAYVFTRVSNLGYRNYQGQGKNLILYWSLPKLGITKQDWLQCNIDSIPIRTSINADSSILLCHRWTIPDTIRTYAASHGGVANINIVATIVNDWIYNGTTVFEDDTELSEFFTFPFEYKNFNSVRNHNNIALQAGNEVDLRTSSREIPIYIQNPDSVARTIDLQFSMPGNYWYSPFSCQLALSDNLFQQWTDGGSVKTGCNVYQANPQVFVLDSDSSVISNITLAPYQTDSIIIRFAYVSNSDYNLTSEGDLIMRDINSTDTIGALSFHLIGPERHFIEPGIDDGGGDIIGPIVGPGFGMNNLNQTNLSYRTLYATGVNEPASYYWYDADRYLLGQGPTLRLNNTFNGWVILKVVAAADQVEAYASKYIGNTTQIMTVSPNPASCMLSVGLRNHATSATSLRLATVFGGQSIMYPVEAGTQHTILNIADLPSGVYTLSLIENDQVIETQQIVKH